MDKLCIIGLVIFPNSLFSGSVLLFTLYMFPNSNTFEKMRNIPNELTSVGRCSFVPGRKRLYPPFEVLHLQVMPFFQRDLSFRKECCKFGIEANSFSIYQAKPAKIGASASLVIKSLIPSSFNHRKK